MQIGSSGSSARVYEPVVCAIAVVDQFVARRREAGRALTEFLQPTTDAKLGEIELEIWRKQFSRQPPSIDLFKVGFRSLY